MGCCQSTIAPVDQADGPPQEGGEATKRKGILSSVTDLREYHQLMLELGAVDHDELLAQQVDFPQGDVSLDDDTCDAHQVRLIDLNSVSSERLDGSDRLSNYAPSETASPGGSFLMTAAQCLSSARKMLSPPQTTRRTAYDMELGSTSYPGSTGAVDRSVSFSPDTPFVEGKPLPKSKKSKALLQQMQLRKDSKIAPGVQ